MRKILFLILALSLRSISLFAWTSETGTGVVSANEAIVRTSLEATQVLQSDLLTNLYGVTILGGTSNYASHDSGGVLSFRNVVSSIDVSKLNRNQFSAYITSTGREVRVGVSNDDVFTVGTNARIQGRVSANDVAVASVYTTSIDVAQIKVSGNATITSSYSTGTCSFTFSNGLLRTATC